jgi:hypothetical protein
VDGHLLSVVEMDGRRIDRVRVTAVTDKPDSDEPDGDEPGSEPSALGAETVSQVIPPAPQ